MPPLDPPHPAAADLSRTLAAIRLDRVRQLTPRRGVVTAPQPVADGSRPVLAPTPTTPADAVGPGPLAERA